MGGSSLAGHAGRHAPAAVLIPGRAFSTWALVGRRNTVGRWRWLSSAGRKAVPRAVWTVVRTLSAAALVFLSPARLICLFLHRGRPAGQPGTAPAAGFGRCPLPENRRWCAAGLGPAAASNALQRRFRRTPDVTALGRSRLPPEGNNAATGHNHHANAAVSQTGATGRGAGFPLSPRGDPLGSWLVREAMRCCAMCCSPSGPPQTSWN